MVPAKSVPGANIILGPPDNWDKEKHGECLSLEVIRNYQDGTWTSMWVPDASELEMLNRGGKVMLVMHSHSFPAVALAVCEYQDVNAPATAIESK